MPDPSAPPGTGVLDEALAIAQPLVRWLVRSGVGYGELAAALKGVFLAEAQAEAQRLNQKPTDSALSLLSGLHRKDVRELRAKPWEAPVEQPGTPITGGRPSPASQVVTRWLKLGWPHTIPFAGPEPSFEALTKSVSKDFHHRAVMQELVRLGVASETDGQVSLLREGFIPQADQRESRQLLAGSVADHLAAGVHNLTTDSPRRFLEQSVFADGLSEESTRQLHRLANDLWAQVLARVVAEAVPLCEQDAQLLHTHRFRLGLFSYSEAEPPKKDQTP